MAKKYLSQRNVYNENILNYLEDNKNSNNQVFSGPGITAAMYMPLMTLGSTTNKEIPKMKVFGDLQTISVSSTRSINPVRVFGNSKPIGWCKGAITFAGTMVFATINQGAFTDLYDIDMAESYINGSSGMLAHYLPPFSVVLTTTNESGAACIRVINNIIITNIGSVYSVDDLYIEEQYTFVATDMTPLIPTNLSAIDLGAVADGIGRFGKNVSTMVEESMKKAYGSIVSSYNTMRDFYTTVNQLTDRNKL